MKKPSFWGTSEVVVVRWIAFIPLFIGIWIFGLNVCSLVSAESDFFVRIPIFGGAAIIGTLVISLPAIITTKPKTVTTILLPVFIIGSLLVFGGLLKQSSSGWQIATTAVFSLMAVVMAFAILQVEK